MNLKILFFKIDFEFNTLLSETELLERIKKHSIEERNWGESQIRGKVNNNNFDVSYYAQSSGFFPFINAKGKTHKINNKTKIDVKISTTLGTKISFFAIYGLITNFYFFGEFTERNNAEISDSTFLLLMCPAFYLIWMVLFLFSTFGFRNFFKRNILILKQAVTTAHSACRLGR